VAASPNFFLRAMVSPVGEREAVTSAEALGGSRKGGFSGAV